MKDSTISIPPSWALNEIPRQSTDIDMRDASVRARGKDPHPNPDKIESVDEYMDRIMGKA